jgi:hypothetical protein
MSDQPPRVRKCTRCGTSVEACDFCDEPDCPAITCHRCVSVALLDRKPAQATAPSASPL